MDQWKPLVSPPRKGTGKGRKQTGGQNPVVAACTSPFWSSESIAQIVLDPTVPAVMHPQRLYEKPRLPVVTGNPTDVYPNKSAKALEILKKKHLIDLGPFSSHAVHHVEYLPDCVTGRPSLEAFLRRGNIVTPTVAVELPLPNPSDSSSTGRQESRYRPSSGSVNRRDQSEHLVGRQVSWSPSVPPPAPQAYEGGYHTAAFPPQGNNPTHTATQYRAAPANHSSPSMPSAWYDVA